MPATARDIFSFSRASTRNALARLSERHPRNLTDVGSFSSQGIGRTPPPIDIKKIPGDAFIPFGTGGRGTPLTQATAEPANNRRVIPHLLFGDEHVSEPAFENIEPFQLQIVGGADLYYRTTGLSDEDRKAYEEVYCRTWEYHRPVTGHPSERDDELYIHPIQAFSEEPIPTFTGSIRVSEDVIAAIPTATLPQHFSIQIEDDSE